MINNELISIIVPVYNTSKFLERCVNSIVNQTYKNIEIILVNDGSTDNSQEIIDKLKNKDSRIKSLIKENGGLSSSRNYGLNIATGKYANFVDSDDYLMPKELEIMYTEMLKHNAQMAICDFALNPVPGAEENYEVIELNNHELMKELFLDQRITSHSWRKIYPMEIFDKYRFPEDGMIVLDMAIDHYFLQFIQKAVYIPSPLYIYYYENPENISNLNNKAFKGSYDRAVRLVERLEFSDKFYPDLSYILVPQMCNFLLSSYVKAEKFNVKQEQKDFIINNIKKHKERIYNDKNISFFNKVVIYSIDHNIKPLISIASWYYFTLMG